jgi:Kef-type K+ transport system membrane component KefB
MTLATISAADDRLIRLFLAIAIIVAVARLAGWAFARMRQPPVIGELLAGIALGPTVLGALPGDPSSALFPDEVIPLLAVVATLGLILFVFLTGLELDLGLLRRRSRSVFTISTASVGLPFALGLLLAAVLFPSHHRVDGHEVEFIAFALFIATAVSVTAFPVLARIVGDNGMRRTELGSLVIACAAVEDVLAWTMLTLALAVAAAQTLWDLPQILGAAVLFAAIMILFIRPLLARAVGGERSREAQDPALLALAACGTALSACVTGAIGVHLVLGAVIFGVAFPRSPGVRERLERTLGPLTLSVLLPVFFALPGLSLNLWDGLDAAGLGELALILAVACVGKLVGATGAARGLGIAWRESTAIGVLINTRGLMEIVVLNVGHTAGIIDTQLYSLFVIMAVTTTLMAGPVLHLLYPSREVPRHLPMTRGGRSRIDRRAVPGGALPADAGPE